MPWQCFKMRCGRLLVSHASFHSARSFFFTFFLCVQSLKGLPGEARRVEKQLVDLWEAGIVASAKRVEHQQIIADLMFFASKGISGALAWCCDTGAHPGRDGTQVPPH